MWLCDHYVWLPQSWGGTLLHVYCFRPVWLTPPPRVCLQPTAAMLIIWRLRWASPTLWWRPSAGCCCSLWARRVVLHRGHGMQKRVGEHVHRRFHLFIYCLLVKSQLPSDTGAELRIQLQLNLILNSILDAQNDVFHSHSCWSNLSDSPAAWVECSRPLQTSVIHI